MLRTDYARILWAIYAFAQIRITRTYRLPSDIDWIIWCFGRLQQSLKEILLLAKCFKCRRELPLLWSVLRVDKGFFRKYCHNIQVMRITGFVLYLEQVKDSRCAVPKKDKLHLQNEKKIQSLTTYQWQAEASQVQFSVK
jgi:hypothetical protein